MNENPVIKDLQPPLGSVMIRWLQPLTGRGLTTDRLFVHDHLMISLGSAIFYISPTGSVNHVGRRLAVLKERWA